MEYSALHPKDIIRTLVRAEYGYPKGPPNTNS
jgi:hypothetical protein